MRDPKRIDDFCERLAAAWKKTPDLRFFQFVNNVATFTIGNDGFYTEDDIAIQKVEEYAEEMSNDEMR